MKDFDDSLADRLFFTLMTFVIIGAVMILVSVGCAVREQAESADSTPPTIAEAWAKCRAICELIGEGQHAQAHIVARDLLLQLGELRESQGAQTAPQVDIAAIIARAEKTLREVGK